MSVVGAIGLAISAVGTVVAETSRQKMVAEQTRASKKAENNREQQMRLDSAQKRRQSIREAVVARAMGLSQGTTQGAGQGSGVASSTGGAIGQGIENQQVISASEQIGGRIFDANREYFDATQRGQSGIAFGQGLSSLGGAIVNNAGEINKLGDYFGNRPEGSKLNRNV